jgi:ankyrin repeat protein
MTDGYYNLEITEDDVKRFTDMGYFDIVKYFILKGAKTKYDKPALVLAVENNRFDIVKYLVEQGADIGWVDADTKKDLRHFAAMYGNEEMYDYFTTLFEDRGLGNNMDNQGLYPVDYLIGRQRLANKK